MCALTLGVESCLDGVSAQGKKMSIKISLQAHKVIY